jgi:hypothetical protein
MEHRARARESPSRRSQPAEKLAVRRAEQSDSVETLPGAGTGGPCTRALRGVQCIARGAHNRLPVRQNSQRVQPDAPTSRTSPPAASQPHRRRPTARRAPRRSQLHCAFAPKSFDSEQADALIMGRCPRPVLPVTACSMLLASISLTSRPPIECATNTTGRCPVPTPAAANCPITRLTLSSRGRDSP